MSNRRRGSNPLANGRNRTARFTKLEHRLLTSGAYRSLSLSARCLLVELMMLYNGANNGSLYLGVRDATDRLGLSDKTVCGNAFRELINSNLVTVTKDSHFHMKPQETSKARCFCVNFLPGPGKRTANLASLDWQPEPGTVARRRMERGLKALKRYTKASTSHRLPVLDPSTIPPIDSDEPCGQVLEFSTPEARDARKPASGPDRESSTHTSTTTVSVSALRLPGGVSKAAKSFEFSCAPLQGFERPDLKRLSVSKLALINTASQTHEPLAFTLLSGTNLARRRTSKPRAKLAANDR